MADQTELAAAVDQLARDMIANNIAGMMPMFTPQGLMQALALQGGEESAEGSDDYEVTAAKGNWGNRYHIRFRGDDGEGGIYTDWLEVDGEWKVDGIGRIEG